MGHHKKLLGFLRPDPAVAAAEPSDDDDEMPSSPTSGYASPAGSPSPYSMSPLVSSPWTHLPGLGTDAAGEGPVSATGLIASLVKEDGHVYSLAAAGDLLYTGTDSKNVRVWKNRREFAGFKASSGLVKAIVVAGDGRIFTGHQDGKVRVWRASLDNPAVHRRVGSLPMLKDFLKSSVNPSNYIDTRRPRRRSAVWLRHFDAVSCLSLDADAGLLYSGSWDRTFKVWRLSDSKCLESVRAHDDAVNTVAAVGFDNVVFTGSADGTVKLWRREAVSGEGTRHVMERVLTKGESAVTAIAVSVEGRIVYVGTSDGAVNVWKWRRGTVRHSGVLKGHKMAVLCLAVAGRVVVTGSADRTLCAWRREGPEHVQLAVLTGHTGPVKCVAMDQEAAVGADRERRLVAYSGSLDGSVKVWRLSDASNMTAEQTAPPLPHAPKGKASPLHVRAPDAASEFKRVAAA